MISDPVFSIITPTRRRPALLARAVRSVARQTFPDYEHLIVDDACDEATGRIVAGFGDPRIVLRRHDRTRGASAAYNTGIRAARGRFILFLDDDDEYLPTLLEQMHGRFSLAGAGIGFIWTGIAKINDAGEGGQILATQTWPATFASRQQAVLAATSIGNGFGLCVRRGCVDAVGLYDETLTAAVDTDFLFRLAKAYGCETIPEVLVYIHQHGSGQLTGAGYDDARVMAMEQILHRHRAFMERYPAVRRAQLKAYAGTCYRGGQKKKGRQAMLAIIGSSPLQPLPVADLLCYEAAGRDAAAVYGRSPLRTLVRFMKNKLRRTGRPVP